MHPSWLLAIPLALLGACAAPPTLDAAPEGFGIAVRHNMEAQIANPERVAEALGPAPGERRALAVQRYQTDRVETPVEIYTRDE